MAPKTRATKKSVSQFLNSIKDPEARKDCKTLNEIMKKVTKEKPVMWGESMVGFGSYHYRYASGREGDWPRIAFSPRAQSLTVYIMPGFKRYKDLMAQLGPHKTGVSCLYVKKLEQIDLSVLKTIIGESFRAMKKAYPA